MKKLQFLLVSVILSLLCTNLSATSYYVTATGVNTNTGLSWASPTTLDAALALATNDDDIIYIGAGTYTPTVNITGVATPVAGDKTFEIKKNISLIGGYPAIPIEGDSPASSNITTFSGATTCYHVVAVTAPVATDKKVKLENISITEGNAYSSTTGSPTINGIANFYRSYAGGIIIGGSVVEINNCKIFNNQSRASVPGVFIFASANVKFDNCSINNNTGAGNGGGIWNEASTVYINNSSIFSNTVTGVAAGIYAIFTSGNTTSTISPKTYIYNTTISNNTASHKTAYYGREKSESIMVNCTIAGNLTTTSASTSTGAGVCLYANTAVTAVKLDIINCTITNNSSIAAGDLGGGIRVNDAYCTLNIYNSIVSGNTVGAVGSKVTGDIGLNTGTYSKKNTIISDKIYDAAGIEVAGKTFDFTTMFGALADNGGAVKTCKLLLAEDVNPAKTQGMSSAELTTLGGILTPAVAESIISYDQLGNLRSGRVIGAWTSNGTATGLVGYKELKKLIVYKDGNDICIENKVNDRVSVYAVSGQLLYVSNAKSNITRIKKLVQGNMYIIKVNGQGVKVIL